MNNVISNDDRIAIAEVDYIIHHMDERYLNKIPSKVLDYITILKKQNIEINIDPRKPLEQQGLKEFALYFIIILNLKYWCNDERRKEILAMMENNQQKFEDKVNKFFEQAESIQGDEKNFSNILQSKNNNDINGYTNIQYDMEIGNVQKNDQNELVINKTKQNVLKKIINKIRLVIKK